MPLLNLMGIICLYCNFFLLNVVLSVTQLYMYQKTHALFSLKFALILTEFINIDLYTEQPPTSYDISILNSTESKILRAPRSRSSYR